METKETGSPKSYGGEQMKKTIFVLMALLIVAVLVITGCAKPTPTPTPTPSPAPTPAPAPAKPEVIEWRMQALFPAGTHDYKFFAESPEGFVPLVKEASGGRLIITPYGSGALLPVPEQFEAIGTGTIEAGIAVAAYWAGKVPAAAFAFGIPYVISFEKDVMAYLTRPYGSAARDVLREEYAKHNVHLLYDLGYTGSPLFSKKPVYTLDDYKGLKTRAIGLGGEVLERLGATMIYKPAPEIYPALETGVIDAAFWGSPFASEQLHLQEVTDYILMPPLTGMVVLEIIVNKDAYEALPGDLKAIVDMAAECYLVRWYQELQYLDAVVLKRMLDEGEIKEVITMPPAEVEKLKQISMEVLAEAGKKDAGSAKMYELLVDYLKLRGIID